jgi:hypothetical protein
MPLLSICDAYVCVQLILLRYAGPCGSYSLLLDVDLRAGDLPLSANGQVANAQADCCQRCMSTPGCTAFTFDAAVSKACWLKGRNVVALPYEGAVSGQLLGQPAAMGLCNGSGTACQTKLSSAVVPGTCSDIGACIPNSCPKTSLSVLAAAPQGVQSATITCDSELTPLLHYL